MITEKQLFEYIQTKALHLIIKKITVNFYLNFNLMFTHK
jgi:hypothetical protein